MITIYLLLLFSQFSPTLCDPLDCSTQASLSFTISWSLLKLMSIKSVMLFNHLILCYPLLLPPSISASGSFPLNRLFTLGGQSIGASASPAVLLMNIQDRFPYGSPCSPRVCSNTTAQNLCSLMFSLLYGPVLTSIHDHQKKHSFD